jgi:hypothetical protein
MDDYIKQAIECLIWYTDKQIKKYENLIKDMSIQYQESKRGTMQKQIFERYLRDYRSTKNALKRLTA